MILATKKIESIKVFPKSESYYKWRDEVKILWWVYRKQGFYWWLDDEVRDAAYLTGNGYLIEGKKCFNYPYVRVKMISGECHCFEFKNLEQCKNLKEYLIKSVSYLDTIEVKSNI